jgi:nitrous oxide reductase accessory protein NosL
MLVAGYPNWVSQIIFSDGTYALFDGPKDMFRYYFSIAKYNPAKKQVDIDAIYVTEYYSTKFMDARKLFFIKGSDVDGPMGVELVPIDSAEKAREFMKDHHGKKVLKFDEVKKVIAEIPGLFPFRSPLPAGDIFFEDELGGSRLKVSVGRPRSR